MRRAALSLLVALAASACGTEASAAVPVRLGATPIETSTQDGLYSVELVTEPAAPRTGELFVARTSVRARATRAPIEGLQVEVDARMPHHGHGMVTRPEHRERGDGVYESHGMKLHMPGRWELVVRVRAGDVEDVARVAIEQPFGAPP